MNSNDDMGRSVLMVGYLLCCSVALEGAHCAREPIARKRQISEFLAVLARSRQRQVDAGVGAVFAAVFRPSDQPRQAARSPGF